MRHRKAKVKLNRSASHRRAMFANMLTGLIESGRVKTTERKARELRRLAERAISRATRLGDILLKERENLDAEDRARLVHAMRMARRVLPTRDAVLRLFDEWAPRYLGRPGGYTRVYKLGFRKGDAAPLALVEFVPADMPEREGDKAKAADEAAQPKKRGLFGFGKKK